MVFLSLVLSSFLVASQPSDRRVEEIDELLSAYHEAGLFNGVALVGFEGEILYERAFGFADFGWQIPNTPETKFDLASISKPFTATLILTLVEEGLLDLEDPIGGHLPSLGPEMGERITLRHLLAHRSGITRDFLQYGHRDGRASWSRGDVIAQIAQAPLDFEPGAAHAYSNGGFIIAAAVVEAACGRPFEVELRERLFEPLEMEDTVCVPENQIVEKRAVGHDASLMGELAVALRGDVDTGIGAGGIVSTARDLFRFDRALAESLILTPSTIEMMGRPQESRVEYGLGWNVRQHRVGDKEVSLIGHTGAGAGVLTLFWRFPDDGHSIILLQNTNAIGRWMEAPAIQITEALYHGTISSAFPSGPTSRDLYQTLFERGVAAAVALYRTMPAPRTRLDYAPTEATGPPDAVAGDCPRAWTPRDPNGGEEWLRVTFDPPVEAQSIRVLENQNAGAIDRLSLLSSHRTVETLAADAATSRRRADGVTMWNVSLPSRPTLEAVTLHLETARVRGWNEIDAVALVDSEGGLHWAKSATASSSAAERIAAGLFETPGELQLRELGKKLISHWRYEDAFAVLTLNATLHPNSVDALSSCAAVALQCGDDSRALEMGVRALVLDANDSRAHNVIRRLEGRRER